MKILLAGDHFVRNDLLAHEITDRLPFEPQLSMLTLPWPEVPFGRVAEVDEASGREDELAAAAADVDVVVTQVAPVTSRVIGSAPELKLIVCTRGGPVNVNTRAATERGIAVSCTPGRNAVAAAEYTLLLMLAAMRRLPEAHTALAAGEWRSGMYAYPECGGEIAGSVVGVVGFGEIGRRVAASILGMGGRVVACDPFVTPDSVGEGIELLALPELLAHADVVTLHARLTAETRGMIGAAELARLRPGAVLVNTARGALLDYAAAARALESGRLGALALDVFPEEPLPSTSPLLRLPRVVLSPHLAGATHQTAARAATMAALEVERYARHQPLAHVVNPVPFAPWR
jgi:D-3-phosphoglycerate dehydrogenase / 2-oxoglutarate reductase